MYGESYDDVVEAMTAQEKLVLQGELAARKAGESVAGLQDCLARQLGESVVASPPSLYYRLEGASLPTVRVTPSTPSAREQEAILGSREQEAALHLEEQEQSDDDEETIVSPSHPRPAAVLRQQFKQPPAPRHLLSPRKGPGARPRWMPASPIPGRELEISPLKPLGRRNVSRLPTPGSFRNPVLALRQAESLPPAQVSTFRHFRLLST